MVSADELADLRQRRLISISSAATTRALRLWGQMDFTDLDGSWGQIAPKVTAQAVSAQLTAARGSDSYTANASSEYDFDAEVARIVPEAFAGADGSGRPVDQLLFGAVTTTKEAVGSGFGARASMESGAAYLAAMMKTVLADLARSADMVSSTGKGFTRYARVVEPGACSRCVVLAGATQFKPFKRHPACKCSVQPVPDAEWARNRRYSPEGAFDAMSRAEQDKAFGKAGAQAIRDGADISQVVSARRGAAGMGYSHRLPTGGQYNRMTKTTIGRRPDGSPVQVYTTSEGNTRRGAYGKAQAQFGGQKRTRLMPESIYDLAGSDSAAAKTLLRDAGYIDQGWKVSAAERLEIARADRAFADAFYQKHNIFLS